MTDHSEILETLKAACMAISSLRLAVDERTKMVIFMDEDKTLGFAKSYEPFVAPSANGGHGGSATKTLHYIVEREWVDKETLKLTRVYEQNDGNVIDLPNFARLLLELARSTLELNGSDELGKIQEIIAPYLAAKQRKHQKELRQELRRRKRPAKS